MGRFGRVFATLAILVGGLLVLFSLADLASRGASAAASVQDGLMLVLGLLCALLGLSAFRRRE
ncbi:MAG: hypothetical protein U1E62_11640 [Alsobacter sp.]